MSFISSRNTRKRPNPANSSSDAGENTFLKRVKATVAGIIPSIITNLFDSRPSSPNRSVQAAEATYSSTEDEDTETEVYQPPPAKRPRQGPFHVTFSIESDKKSVVNNDLKPANREYYSNVRIKGRPTYRRARCIGSTSRSNKRTNVNVLPSCVINDDSQPVNQQSSPKLPVKAGLFFRKEHNSVLNTSTSNEDTISVNSEDITTSPEPLKSRDYTLRSNTQGIDYLRKSLFSPGVSKNESLLSASDKSSHSTTKGAKQPSCNARSGSTFYSGPTMYGGAASIYVNNPYIREVQSHHIQVNDPVYTGNNYISAASLHILELLENYSSPLTNATTMSNNITESNKSPNTITTKDKNKIHSYKTQELHVPTLATILNIKKNSRLMESTAAARQLLASHSSQPDSYSSPCTYYIKSDKETQTDNKSKTEIKRKLTRSKRIEDETAPLTPVTSDNAALDLDNNNLPVVRSFNHPVIRHSTPISTQVSLGMAVTPQLTTESNETINNSDTASRNYEYEFSQPVGISSLTHENMESLPEFDFETAKEFKEKSKTDEDENKKKVNITDNKVTTPKTKDWRCSDCWVNNKPDVEKCVCCGCRKPSVENQGAVKCSLCKVAVAQSSSGKCVNCEKVSNENRLTVSKPIGQFQCADCWANNDVNAEKCVCCGAKNPKKSNVEEHSAIKKNKEADWRCQECLIKNENTSAKCMACGTSKPGTMPSSNTTLTNDITSQIWECSVCLIRNENDRMTCVCCTSERPGHSKTAKNKFNFGNNSFKFGIDLKMGHSGLGQNNTVAKTSNVNSNMEATETNNNIVAKIPFTFGIPMNATVDQTKNENVKEIPKLNFTFGQAPNTSTPQTAVSFKFGIVDKLSDSTLKVNTKEKENPQEVPKIIETQPVLAVNSTPLESHNIAMNPTIEVSEAVNNTAITENTVTTETKEAAPSTMATNVLQKSMFKYRTVMAPSTMSGMSEDTTSSITFGTEAQTTTMALTEHIYQKNITVTSCTTTTPSLFQAKNGPSTTTISLFSENTSPLSTNTVFFKKDGELTTTSAPSTTATNVLQEPMFKYRTVMSPSNLSGMSKDTTSSITFGTDAQTTTMAVPEHIHEKNITVTSCTTTTPSLFQAKNGPSTTTISLFSENTPLSTNTVFFKKDGELTTTSSLFQNGGQAESSGSVFKNSEIKTVTTTVPSAVVTAPVFSFGINSDQQQVKPQESNKFSFTFGSNNPNVPLPMFKTTFCKNDTNATYAPSTFTFSANYPSGDNSISGGSSLPSLSGNNGLSENNLPGIVLSNANNTYTAGSSSVHNQSEASQAILVVGNNMQGGNATVSTESNQIFGVPAQNENMWSSGNMNMFGDYKEITQKPDEFTFGSSTNFNSNNTLPAFNNPAPQMTTATMFGVSNQNMNNQALMYSNPVQNQPAANLFGNPQATFGTHSTSATSTFGTNNVAPVTSNPSFNFGASLPSNNVFGFGHQQQPQQYQAQQHQPQQHQPQQHQPQQHQPQQQGSGFGFGASSGSGPLQVQFNMGSSPNLNMRRIRRAVRRNPQR